MDERQTIKNRKVLIICAIVLLVAVPVAFYFINIANRRNVIENAGSEKVGELGKVNLEAVEKRVKILLKSYYDYSDDDLEQVKMIVREDSMKITYDEKGKVDRFSFLVDLNKPELTYLISKDVGGDIMATCPEIGLAKNPDVFCIGTDQVSTIDVMLDKYLPYSATTDDGYYFTIWHDKTGTIKPRLDMYANICNDEKVGESVMMAIKAWIKDKGVNPDIVPINYQASYCEHGND